MEELLRLRKYIEHGQYTDALLLVGEMEEMSRDDKVQKIESFLQILLVHLIEQARSLDGAQRNPGCGVACRAVVPGCAALHPGYGAASVSAGPGRSNTSHSGILTPGRVARVMTSSGATTLPLSKPSGVS